MTNVPDQALTLLNDRFVLDQAGVWGRRVVASNVENVSDRVTSMVRDALGREPDAPELATFGRLVDSLAGLHEVGPDDVPSSQAVWKDVAHVLFNLKEFIYVP